MHEFVWNMNLGKLLQLMTLHILPPKH